MVALLAETSAYLQAVRIHRLCAHKKLRPSCLTGERGQARVDGNRHLRKPACGLEVSVCAWRLCLQAKRLCRRASFFFSTPCVRGQTSTAVQATAADAAHVAVLLAGAPGGSYSTSRQWYSRHLRALCCRSPASSRCAGRMRTFWRCWKVLPPGALL